jgi:Phage head-tail joining protein
MPGPLTAAQLAFLQTMAQIYTLDLTANTTRNTAAATTDVYGNPTETWTAVLTSVACSVGDPSPSTQQLYPQAFIGAERKAKISFPVGSDVRRNDRATIGGRTYRIEVDIGRDSFSLLGQFVGVQINEGFD